MSARLLALLALLALLTGLLAGCGDDDAAPDPIRQGRAIYGDLCSLCHGDGGQGGVGPSLGEVVETWPDCADHIEWIALGSDRWKETHGDTYGATGKPVAGGMPAHDQTLTADERALVAAFERVTYGSAHRQSTLTECGVDPGG
ncbi:MAG: c-type cytochrome [Acidimicrobiia bacterium]|nr:c-type cytochrome [Acidimicrobiia bacterium]